jgi:hypothetical protein
MGKKILIYIAGIVTGVIMTFGVLAIVAVNNRDKDDITYFKTPINYEDKESTSFKVFQVLDNGALANEISNDSYMWYNGKTVLLLNGQFYCDQVIELEHPKQVGTFKYMTQKREVSGTTVGGNMMTVPVIDVN